MAGMDGSSIMIQTQVLSFVILHVKILTASVMMLRNEVELQGALEPYLGNETVHRMDLGILIRLLG